MARQDRQTRRDSSGRGDYGTDRSDRTDRERFDYEGGMQSHPGSSRYSPTRGGRDVDMPRERDEEMTARWREEGMASRWRDDDDRTGAEDWPRREGYGGDYGREAGREYERGYRDWARDASRRMLGEGRYGDETSRTRGGSGRYGEEGGGGWSGGSRVMRGGPPVEGGFGYTGGGYGGGSRYGTDGGYGGGEYRSRSAPRSDGGYRTGTGYGSSGGYGSTGGDGSGREFGGGGWLTEMGGGEPYTRGEERHDSGRSLMERVKRFFGKGPRGYKRSDDRIREDVCDRLSDGYLDASEVEVDVQGGEVTLKGHVTHKQFKRMAEDIAEHVSGVQQVHNHIRVKREGDEAPAEGNGTSTKQPKPGTSPTRSS
jgi:hypothetical protein